VSDRPRIGVLASPKWPVGELPDTARRVEALGFDELWLAEDCFLYGGLTAAATVLALTERLTVGIGLLPVSVRNAAIVAMELATLAELHPGRLEVAFGHGVEAWMRQIGARPPDRLVALREVVAATRELLHGETVTRAGRFLQLDGVTLERAPAQPPPLLIGTTGERGIGVARDVADGLLLAEGAGEAAVAWAAGLLGGRGKVVAYSWLRIDEDAARAREDLLPAFRAWQASGLYPNLVSRGGADPASVAAVGTPEDCARWVRRLHGAGASTVVLAPVGPDPERQLADFVLEAT
jgi:5,10-methylenetetrahydromethanopterin reductase